MKAHVLLIASSLSFSVFGQVSKSILDFNNTDVIISNNGSLFHNASMTSAGYEVPKGMSANAIFASAFLSYATDANGGEGGSVHTYEKYEFFPGPIATDYTTTNYLNKYQTSLWKISQSEINQHIADWNTIGYIVPGSIAAWPGNGDVSNGEAQLLAPYVDVNTDGVYSPELGDYPEIRGDVVVYAIMNDANGIHQGSGFTSLGLELHVMLYQYITTDELNNANFLSAVVVNRSVNEYNDYHFGLFVDFDLGNYNDDYVGTDINRNLAYVYNGDLLDENSTSSSGYQANPPGFGVLSLNNTLSSNVEFSNITSPTIPGVVRMMKGLNAAGTPILDNMGTEVKHMYAGTATTGWSEVGAANPPGDRRNVLGFDPIVLQANGGQHCYDFAFVYDRNQTTNQVFEAVDSLLLTSDFVQQFYDAQSNSCYLPIAQVGENIPLEKVIVYPNPATDVLKTTLSGEADFEVVSAEGKIIVSGKTNLQQIDIKLLHSGLYLLILKQNGNQYRSNFIKE